MLILIPVIIINSDEPLLRGWFSWGWR